MNSLLVALGRKFIFGVGGLGGGISSSVFFSCLRSVSLAVVCRLVGELVEVIIEVTLVGVELV